MTAETSKNGYMLFMSERPLIGIDPHPDCAPQYPESQDASGWFAAYNCSETKSKSEADVEDDADYYDDELPDIFPVTVHADGTLEIWYEPSDHGATGDRFLLAKHTPKDIFGAFGMDAPKV